MAIIIEGISKGPIKGHDAQLLLHGDGIVMEKFNGVYQTLGAGWKEIPDRHGDLKDEMDIIHRIEEKIADADLAQDIIGEILASPTIVEASE